MSVELLKKAIDGFALELDRTTDLSSPTKCEGWDATALLEHIVGMGKGCNVALRGGTREQALAVAHDNPLGDDPRVAFRESMADHVAAFSTVTDWNAVVAHPLMDMPGGQVLMFRVVDLLLHTWDLAAGQGRDVALDPDVVRYAWDNLSPIAGILASTGMFGEGPSGTVPETADPQTRLIDLTGRRA